MMPGVMPILLQKTETRAEFDWGHMPELWIIALVIIPLIALVAALVYRRERVAGPGWVRWPLAVLRVLVVLAILIFLAQPILRSVTFQTRDPRLLLFVDDSLSMGIVDRFSNREIPRKLADVLATNPDAVERLSRFSLVNRFLTRDRDGDSASLLEQLREKMDLSLYTFSGSLKRVAELARRDPDDPAVPAEFSAFDEADMNRGDERVKQTNLGEAVFDAMRDLKSSASGGGPGVAGIVVFTDGQNNAGVVQPEEMAVKLKQLGIPLLIVGVGNPDPAKNIRAVALDVDSVVLVGDDVRFDATFIPEGFEGENVQVDLVFDDQVVDTEYVSIGPDSERQTVRLDHTPTRAGDFTATVKIEKLSGELFAEDNIVSRPVTVLDQKIKVLYVEGLPRWEYRYLKNALVRDPTVEAQIILYDADREFRQESSPGIPPLVKFPETTDELFKYHVIIIGDVDPNRRDPSGVPFARNLELIQKFVGDSGGGVVFITGSEANPHEYLQTPLYPLIPVEIEERGLAFESTQEIVDPFNVRLAGTGKEHPVMRLDNDRERNTLLWENDDGVVENHLPGFYWYARVKQAKPAGIPLAYHPTARDVAGDQNVVIFAIQNYGKGSVFYSGVDETWRWRAGVANLYFYRFWGQVLRYAASGRLRAKTPRFSIATDKQVYTIGETVTVDCKVYDANMEPSTAPRVTVYHSVKGREFESVETIEVELNASLGPGSYEGKMNARRLGSHDLWLGTEAERLALVTFTVEVPPLEFRNPRLDADRMKKVAALAQGKYYELHEFKAAVDFLVGSARPRQIPIEESQDDLWDESWVLFAFTGLIAAEWILRKWVRLL